MQKAEDMYLWTVMPIHLWFYPAIFTVWEHLQLHSSTSAVVHLTYLIVASFFMISMEN